MNNSLYVMTYNQSYNKKQKISTLWASKKGFTLIELLVVMVILVTLVGIMLPKVNGFIMRSKVAKVIADCKVIESAVLRHYYDTSEWPRILKTGSYYSPTGNLECLCSNNSSVNNWNGPYLRGNPKNPFSQYGYQLGVFNQNPYTVRTNSSGTTYAVPFKTGDYVLAITIEDYNDRIYMQDKLDEMIDNNDGGNSGKVQWSNSFSMIAWIIENGVTGVKSTDDSLQVIFSMN